MNKWTGTVCALAVAAAAFASPAPARAQFLGEEMGQFAPMLETMKRKMGKRRYGQFMRTMGPMMADIMDGSGGGGLGGFGSMQGMDGLISMAGSFDFGSMRGLIGSGGRRSRRAHAP